MNLSSFGQGALLATIASLLGQSMQGLGPAPNSSDVNAQLAQSLEEIILTGSAPLSAQPPTALLLYLWSRADSERMPLSPADGGDVQLYVVTWSGGGGEAR